MQLPTRPDHATRERLARSLAEYYYRRTLGVRCPDSWSQTLRAELEEAHRRKLALARHTLDKLAALRCPAAMARPARLAHNVIPWERPPAATAARTSPAPRQALASSASSMATGLPP